MSKRTAKKRVKRGRVVARCWVVVSVSKAFSGGRLYIREPRYRSTASMTANRRGATEFASVRDARDAAEKARRHWPGDTIKVFRRGKRGPK